MELGLIIGGQIDYASTNSSRRRTDSQFVLLGLSFTRPIQHVLRS
jgi:hypothetical protein